MKLKVDQQTCIGCNLCAQVAPEIFYMKENGKAEVSEPVDFENDSATIKHAVEICPVVAIILEKQQQ